MPWSKQIGVFLAVTFGWTWLFWGAAALHAQDVVTLPAGLAAFLDGPFNPAAWGPLIGALTLCYLHDGFAGMVALLRRGLQFRLGWQWYLAVFATFPVLIGGAFLLAALFGAPMPEIEALANPVVIPVAFLFILFLGGPIQEEFGWRGILQDRLQDRMGALYAALIVGVIWGIWHTPLFFMPTQDLYYERPMWGLVLSTTLISVLFAWIYNNTARSMAAMVLLHTMYNFTHFLVPTLKSDAAALTLFGLQAAAIVVIVAIWGPHHLSRRAAPEPAGGDPASG